MSPTRRIDATAWANLLASMLKESGVSQSELARRIGVDRKSVQRWLKTETSVTADNVRDTARALGYDDQATLAAVGFLAAPAAVDPADELPEPLGRIRDDEERELWGLPLPEYRRLELILELRHAKEREQLREAWERRDA